MANVFTISSMAHRPLATMVTEIRILGYNIGVPCGRCKFRYNATSSLIRARMSDNSKMKILNSDVTFVFEKLTSVLGIRELLASAGLPEGEKFQAIEAEGLRVFFLPEKNLVISVEQNKLIVRDLKPEEGNLGRVVDIANKIYNVAAGDASPKLYGFNILGTIELETAGQPSTLVNDVLVSKFGDQITSAGINLNYGRDGAIVRTRVEFIGESFKKIQVAFNYENNGDEARNKDTLNERQKQALTEMKRFLKLLNI